MSLRMLRGLARRAGSLSRVGCLIGSGPSAVAAVYVGAKDRH
jgi:hypothetical protein